MSHRPIDNPEEGRPPGPSRGTYEPEVDDDLEAARIGQALDPNHQVQLQLMQACSMLPTWSPKLTYLGLVNKRGLLTELGERVATWLDRSNT